MVILAFYGIHRYQLVWLYYRNKKKAAKLGCSRSRGSRRSELPFVTIQLPIFNEQFVIRRLIDACCRLEYPRDRFEIQVLDDSTDETTEVARAIVERYAAGYNGLGAAADRLSASDEPVWVQGRGARRGAGLRAASSWRSSMRTLCLRGLGHEGDPSLRASRGSAWCRRGGRT